MPKLTYWVSECLDDSRVYNIRTKTKKEAVAEREARIRAGDHESCWGPVFKCVVEYDNAFDLMLRCSDESHHYWEYKKEA